MAGWWKADGSGFCGSGPRYYYDCNAACNGCGCGRNGVCEGSCSGTKCGCAQGDCNNRKSGCTKFRYGQCNNQIECVGPIVCRVITCTAPWDLYPDECSTATATDNNTRFHNRPCLQGGPSGRVTSAVKAPGGRIRVRGYAVDPDTAAAIKVHVYVDDKYVKGATADIARPDIADTHRDFGINHGFDVSVPVSDGSHKVCVYGINKAGGGKQRSAGLPHREGRRTGLRAPRHRRGRVRRRAGQGLGHRSRHLGTHHHPGLHRRQVGRRLQGRRLPARRRPRPSGLRDQARVRPGDPRRSGAPHRLPVRHQRQRHRPAPAARLPDGHRRRERPATATPAVRRVGGCRSGTSSRRRCRAISVRVRGWSIDPDTSKPVTIRVYLNGKWLAGFTADVRRKDVARVHPGYGDRHGFDKRIRIPRGRHQLKVYAINNSGTPHKLLGARTVSPLT